MKKTKRANKEKELIKITEASLLNAGKKFKKDKIYYGEFKLLDKCIKKFPKNTDISVIALKCGIIDITNSTHLSQHKSSMSIVDLARKIKKIKNLDKLIKKGDKDVVDRIARGDINLLSFASKYCTYHNICKYHKDDYSIYDGVVMKKLPEIFKLSKYKNTVEEFKNNHKKGKEKANKKYPKNGINLKARAFTTANYKKEKFSYKDYCDAINEILKMNNIKNKKKRRLFDNLIWHKFRKNQNDI